MPLKSRNIPLGAVAKEAKRKPYRLSFKQRDSDGSMQAVGPGGEIVQKENLDESLPYGFYGSPPSDAELVTVPCEGADVVVGVRAALPGAVPTTGSSGTIYSAGGGYVQAANGGDIDAEPEGGAFFKVGATATKALALDGDYVHKSPAGALQTWMAQVDLAITNLAAGNPAVAPFPAASTFTNIGSVTATSTKGKGE